MAVNRAHIVDKNLIRFLRNWTGRNDRTGHLSRPVRSDSRLLGRELL